MFKIAISLAHRLTTTTVLLNNHTKRRQNNQLGANLFQIFKGVISVVRKGGGEKKKKKVTRYSQVTTNFRQINTTDAPANYPDPMMSTTIRKLAILN